MNASWCHPSGCWSNALEGIAIDTYPNPALWDALEVIAVLGGCDSAVCSHRVGESDMSQKEPPRNEGDETDKICWKGSGSFRARLW